MMCDDQRWDASRSPQHDPQDANMDRIGREGIVFKNAFITNSLCGAERADDPTGTYSHTNGMSNNRRRRYIKRTRPWMPDLLRAAGYEVAFCGKSHQKNAVRDRKWDYTSATRARAATRSHHRRKDGRPGQGLSGMDDDVVTDHR